MSRDQAPADWQLKVWQGVALEHMPTAQEWSALKALAQRQADTGVGFVRMYSDLALKCEHMGNLVEQIELAKGAL